MTFTIDGKLHIVRGYNYNPKRFFEILESMPNPVFEVMNLCATNYRYRIYNKDGICSYIIWVNPNSTYPQLFGRTTIHEYVQEKYKNIITLRSVSQTEYTQMVRGELL